MPLHETLPLPYFAYLPRRNTCCGPGLLPVTQALAIASPARALSTLVSTSPTTVSICSLTPPCPLCPAPHPRAPPQKTLADPFAKTVPDHVDSLLSYGVEDATVCCFDKRGAYLAVGYATGIVVIWDFVTRQASWRREGGGCKLQILANQQYHKDAVFAEIQQAPFVTTKERRKPILNVPFQVYVLPALVT